MFLFLDDNPVRTRKFKSSVPSAMTAETAQEMIQLLEKTQDAIEPRYVFLDHDLGGEVFVDSNRKDCGMEVVRWIVANKPILDTIVLHTLNHEAAKMMHSELIKAGYKAEVKPFTSLRLE